MNSDSNSCSGLPEDWVVLDEISEEDVSTGELDMSEWLILDELPDGEDIVGESQPEQVLGYIKLEDGNFEVMRNFTVLVPSTGPELGAEVEMDNSLYQPSKTQVKRKVVEKEGSLWVTVVDPVRRKRRLGCPVCDGRFPKVKRHVQRFHLPWYIYPNTACWTCGFQSTTLAGMREHFRKHDAECLSDFGDDHLDSWTMLVCGFLISLTSELGITDVRGLLRHVQQTHSFHDEAKLTEEEVILFKEFSRRAGVFCPTSISVAPPNCVAALLHWRVLASILHQLSEDRRQYFWKLEKMASSLNVSGGRGFINGYRGKKILTVVDAHCHVGEVLDRFNSMDLQSVLAEQVCSPEGHVVESVISNHCFSNRWKTADELKRLQQDNKIYFAVGVHPRFVSEDTMWDELLKVEELLDCPKVVALGEIGLDFSKADLTDKQKVVQQHILELLLPLAVKYQLPVVLHTRGGESHEVTLCCLEILKRTLTPEHPLHVHCFSGDEEEVQMWLSSFPAAIFGVTAKIGSQEPTVSAIRQIPLQKLVIETDSPYLLPQRFRGKVAFHHPGLAIEAARLIAKVKNMPLSVVCEVTRTVAKSFYQI